MSVIGVGRHLWQRNTQNRTAPALSSVPVIAPPQAPGRQLIIASVRGLISGIDGNMITFVAEKADYSNRITGEKISGSEFKLDGKDLFDPSVFRQFPAGQNLMAKLPHYPKVRDGDEPAVLTFKFFWSADGKMDEAAFIDLKQ